MQHRIGAMDVGLQHRSAVACSAVANTVAVPQDLDLTLDVVGDALGHHAELVHQRTDRRQLVVDGRVIAFGDGDDRHRLAWHGITLPRPPVLNDAVDAGHRLGGVVPQRLGHDVLAGAEVVDGQLAELLRDRLPRFPVRLGLPGRIDRRVEGMDERMHVGGAEVVLLVPGGRGQHDVGQDRAAGHPEVDGHEQVELSLPCLVRPLDAVRTVLRGGFHGRRGTVGAEQVAQEVLVAFGRAAEQVGAPQGQHPRVVVLLLGRLDGEL